MAHQVVLSWAAPDDATTFATYNIYRSSGLCPQSTGFSRSNATGITGLTFTDTSVQVGKSYCYYGTHVEGTSESVPSNQAGGTVTPHTVVIQLVMS